MKFGIALPTYPSGATVSGVVKVAQAAERLGFSSAWTTDHVIMPPDEAGPYREIFEPLMMLAYLAALTDQIKLGISVIVVPQRNGIVLAKELATLDHLCQGRLIVGVGAGWNQKEFEMLDAGARYHRRGQYLDETIRVWRHLWSNPDHPFEGDFYNLPAVAFAPLPVQAGGPPIWVGGSSDAARRRAGRVGAAWHPVGLMIDQFVEQSHLVLQSAQDHGRPAPQLAPRLPIRFRGDAGPNALSASGRVRLLEGDPQDLVRELRAYEHAGATEIVCHFGSPDGNEVVGYLERFSREVMPEFAE